MRTCAGTGPQQHATRCPLPTKVQALRSTRCFQQSRRSTAELQAGINFKRCRALTLVENGDRVRLVFLQVVDDGHRIPVHSAAASVR